MNQPLASDCPSWCAFEGSHWHANAWWDYMPVPYAVDQHGHEYEHTLLDLINDYHNRTGDQ